MTLPSRIDAITIREFAEGDEAVLFEVFRSAVHLVACEDYDSDQLEAWAPADYDLAQWRQHIRRIRPFVAERQGLVVGYADLQPGGTIEHFFVSGRHPGQGIGLRLMQHLLERATERQVTELRADVSLTARPFFARFGFVVTEQRAPRRRGVVLPGVRMLRPSALPGTEGYAEQALDLIPHYESIPFELTHRAELRLLPPRPSRVLDIGAGTGLAAAWFAERGASVLAVEPVTAFREAGIARHPHPAIEWVADALPGLDAVRGRRGCRGRYDVIVLSAVWMHLAAAERRAAMPRIAALLAPSGLMLLSLRHGPVPTGRRMFEVSADETIELARREGLQPVLRLVTGSWGKANRAAGVTWTRLAFRAGSGPDRGSA